MKKTIVLLALLISLISCTSSDPTPEQVKVVNYNCKRVFSLEYYNNRIFAELITEDEWESLSAPGLHPVLKPIKIEVTEMSPTPKLNSKICSDNFILKPF
jgi:hypothetical protein